MIIYFDTETTGLYPGRVIQLSYVIEKDCEVIGKNFYFMVDSVPEAAVKIHNISTEKLRVLSKEKTFEDYAEEIENDFKKASKIVAHNLAFDLSFMHAEFSNLNKVFTYTDGVDSMKLFTPVCKLLRKSGGYKYPKLSEAAEFFGVTSEEVDGVCKTLFGSDNSNFHDARFDSVMLYLCMQKNNCK